MVYDKNLYCFPSVSYQCYSGVYCHWKQCVAVSCCFSFKQTMSWWPVKGFSRILQRTKQISYLKCRCKEAFPCWEPHAFQTTLAEYMVIHSFVLLSMTAHKIVSWQWVTVPYFPVPNVVDKMGEKQFGHVQIATIITYRAAWQQHISHLWEDRH